jgi:uncharacterized protein with PIN domain
MAIIKRRDRFVLFRLSQDEYQRLRSACEEDGAASISAFARSEILKALDRDGPPLVAQQLSTLQSSLELITQMLEAMVKSPNRRNRNGAADRT